MDGGFSMASRSAAPHLFSDSDPLTSPPDPLPKFKAYLGMLTVGWVLVTPTTEYANGGVGSRPIGQVGLAALLLSLREFLDLGTPPSLRIRSAIPTQQHYTIS